MDVLLTVAMLGLMVAALVLLGRTWPRSARTGGYRAGRGHGAGDPAGLDGSPQAAIQEDDDASWSWPSDAGPGEPRA